MVKITKNSEFFSSFSINSSFNRLESLVIIEIPSAILILLLTNLVFLSCLFLLTIDMRWTLSEVDRLIFALPNLKHIKCLTEEVSTSVSLCTMICYTLQLCHLNLMDLSESHSNNGIILLVNFSNLTYLSIEMCSITLDELEIFITEMEQIDLESVYLTNFEPPDQFNSLFWNERKSRVELFFPHS
ncbi:unnamed protein product [Rotaria sp. Silwood2]|nr:unnamed protein product [Rotaria sp. Silwood2]